MHRKLPYTFDFDEGFLACNSLTNRPALGIIFKSVCLGSEVKAWRFWNQGSDLILIFVYLIVSSNELKFKLISMFFCA